MAAPLKTTTLPWEDFDRGHVNNGGIVARKCTIDYLTALYVAYVDSLDNGDSRRNAPGISHLLLAVVEELGRLQSHPPLYPSNTTRTRFVRLLESAIERRVSKYDDQKHRFQKLELQKEMNLLALKEDAAVQSLNRPTFKSDMMPWEQFFLCGSPGSGITLPQFSLGTVQIMPVAGLALLTRWQWKMDLISDKWRIAKSRLSTTTKQRLDRIPKGHLPPSNLQYESTLFTIAPNLYFEHHFPTIKDTQVVDKLESFNSIIDLLETGNYTDYGNGVAGIRAMLYFSMERDP